jgi:hypothetical protein
MSVGSLPEAYATEIDGLNLRKAQARENLRLARGAADDTRRGLRGGKQGK